MDPIQQTIAQILMNKLFVVESKITFDADFSKDLGMDSIDHAQIILEFEKKFKFCIPYDDAERLTTFGRTVSYVRNRLMQRFENNPSYSNYAFQD